jgi:tetratricopeptide (TPR) repeat protein
MNLGEFAKAVVDSAAEGAFEGACESDQAHKNKVGAVVGAVGGFAAVAALGITGPIAAPLTLVALAGGIRAGAKGESAVKGVAKGTISVAGNVAKGAGSVAENVAKNAGSVAENVAKGAGSVAGNVASGAGSIFGNVTKGITGGITGVLNFFKSEEDFLNQGIEKLQNEKYKEAIEDFTQAIEINSQYADAYLLRGCTRLEIDDYQGAIADYTQTIQLLPDDADIYFLRGKAYIALDDDKSAIADFTQSIKINPQYLEAYYLRGCIHSDIGNHQEAIADFQKAISLFYQESVLEEIPTLQSELRMLQKEPKNTPWWQMRVF